MGRDVSPEQKSLQKGLRDEEQRYVSSLKEAEKALGGANKEFDDGIKAAERELERAKNPPPLGSYGSVKVWEDKVQTSSGNWSLLEGPVEAEVEATGNVTAHKKDKIDTRELYLKVKGSGRVHVEKGNPDDGEKVRQLAAKIENASGCAAKQKQIRDEAVAQAERELTTARADRSKIEASEQRLAEVHEQKAALDARRCAPRRSRSASASRTSTSTCSGRGLRQARSPWCSGACPRRRSPCSPGSSNKPSLPLSATRAMSSPASHFVPSPSDIPIGLLCMTARDAGESA